jgi:hypothetical protein
VGCIIAVITPAKVKIIQSGPKLWKHFKFCIFPRLFNFFSAKMKSLTNLREAIICAHNRGKSQHQIADFLMKKSSKNAKFEVIP